MRIFKTVTILFSGLVLLVGALFASLQTSQVQKKIATLACGYAKERGINLSIETIAGSFPFSFKLNGVSIERKSGETVYLNDVKIRFKPLALLHGEINGRIKASITSVASQNLQGLLQGKLLLKSNRFAAKIEGRDLTIENEKLSPISAKIHAVKEGQEWRGKIEFENPAQSQS